MAACGLAFVLPLTACSRQGTLSGDVFVTMKSGDVKRAADVEVALGVRTDQFEADWRKAEEDFRRDFERIKRSLEKAEADLEKAFPGWRSRMNRMAQSQTGETETKGLVENLVYTFDIRAHPSYLELQRLTTEGSGVIRAHKERLEKLVLGNLAKRTRTDVNGHYTFTEVARGRYYLLARHQVLDNRLCWYVPVSLESSSQAVNLSNSSAGCPFATDG